MKQIFGIVAMAALALGSCNKKPELTITNAEVRLPAVPRGPAAAYFTIHGGPTDDRLIEVTSPNAIRAEMHESTARAGVASMKPITSVDVPAKSTVKFESGGKHVMFFDVNPALQPPRTMPLDFVFASGARFEVSADLKRPGD